MCAGYASQHQATIDSFDVSNGRAAPIEAEEQEGKSFGVAVHKIELETEAQCVDRIELAAKCNVTIGELRACMSATMADPCEGPRSPACQALRACHAAPHGHI
jgi:hypothetical protein